MFGRLLKFELGFQSKQIGFWIAALAMLVLGILTPWMADALGGSLAGEKIKVNGAQIIAGSVASWDLAAVFFGAIFVVTGILRDKTHKMLEIIHATPVSTFDMTGTRMVGIYLTVLICILANTFGQFLGQFNPKIDAEVLGPINPLYYIQPMILFTMVNALVVTAFFTLIAGITQNRMLVFVSAIGLFFWTIMSGMAAEFDLPKWAEALTDPFGNMAFALDTEFWPTEDVNERMLPVFGYVGLNRLVWGGISIAVLAGVFGLFKRGVVTGKTKLKTAAISAAVPAIAYKASQPRTGIMANLIAVIERTKFEYLTTVRSVPFLIMGTLAASLFAFLTIITVFFSPQKLVPTSQFMVTIGFTSFMIPIVLIISFFSGEMIWRDKTVGFGELLDSTRVKNSTVVLGKWLALSLIMVTFCLIAIAIGMVVQVAADGPPINAALYFKYAFLNVLPTYLALTFLALFVQSFAPNRIVGMLFAAAAMAATFFISRLPFYHPLMGYSGTSPGRISEIAPYNDWVYFQWFNLYWGALCVLFAVISIWLWRRGLQDGLLKRIKSIVPNITPATGGLAALALATFIGSGIYIHKAYDKVDWRNSKARELAQVKAEKMLEREIYLKLPKIQSVIAEADIYPERQEATIKGQFFLKNTWDEPITELYAKPPTRHAEDVKVFDITGAVRVTEGVNEDGDKVSDIEATGQRLYRFEPPLAPGAEATLTFETFFHAPRLADRSVIAKNGTFLNNYGSFQTSASGFPILGAQYEPIRNPDKRRKYDLGEIMEFPDRDNMEARQDAFFGPSGNYIDFEAKVCTTESQIPIAPGDFISETLKDGRRCRRYQTDTPISNFFSILSGDYDVTEDSWTSPTGKVIPIRVYHGENHTYSVASMIDSVKFGLSHYTEKFGPYQYNYVRIMEIPFISFAQAFAGTIPYSEQGFIMDSGEADDIKSLDNAAQTTMHEMAHQWFGHQIVPGATRGYNVQSEGLTSYAALDAYEEKYGWDKALYALEKATIEPMIALMFIDRSDEPPLAVASTQQYLVYNKADWVLWSLKHYMGREKMQAAMASYIEEFGQKGPPYPTTLELTAHLKAAAGPDFHQLIEDQWDRITYWELEYGEDDISVTPNSDGTYNVKIPFSLDKKISTEDEPKQISISEIDGQELNEWVEIGFYKNKPKDKWSDWIALERVRVNKAESTLSFDLPERPNFIALDPRRLLQERNVEDNVKELPAQVASSK